MTRRSPFPGLALAAALGLAPPAGAHPHVFIDGGVDFLFDAEGRIASLRVTWIYDDLNSLFMFEELGIDADGVLPAVDRARLAAWQTDWFPEFEGDSYLWDGDRRIGLSRPRAPDAEIRDGKAVIRFLRDVEAPFRPGSATRTVVQIYDPTYFTAYSVTAEPRLEGAAGDCRAEVVPFAPTGPLAALQQQLNAIPIDGDPEDEVGALFAERVFVACD